jgi:hypothetical protein
VGRKMPRHIDKSGGEAKDDALWRRVLPLRKGIEQAAGPAISVARQTLDKANLVSREDEIVEKPGSFQERTQLPSF